MREERTIHLAEIPLGGQEGFVWNRLHGEREEICEALVKEETEGRRKTLQTRLRTVDDALDRLMSGSYGNCSNCGRSIDEPRLDPTLDGSALIQTSLCNLCVLCASVVVIPNNSLTTENTEVAQREALG